MIRAKQERRTRKAISVAVLLGCIIVASLAQATDHIVTIAGGYEPQGNQASLEANVLFFQKLLPEKHRTAYSHRVHFADGFDSKADLQVAVKNMNSSQPEVIKLLEEVFAPPGGRVIYRNHRVPNISGSNQVWDIKNTFEALRVSLHTGDRLIVYVTAHGGSADKKSTNEFDTSISCWNDGELSMEEFSTWLDRLPTEVPVILVMAQCYCGGFSHAIFRKGDSQQGLAAQLRVGFFAQQHDLPAAGCRPDIDDDEEYSSYFWGAIAGTSRTGKPIENIDLDKDAKVSLAEAHAYAVIYSQTIDLPLRSTDALLREYSRIPDYDGWVR